MSAVDKQSAARVLVIEDDMWVRSLLADLLPAEGYSVEQATNGATGIRLAKKNRPDVVVLDLAMPEISGADVIRALKTDSSTADIPVIVVSAYASQLQGGEARSVAAVIQKPFDVDELIAQVQRATSARG